MKKYKIKNLLGNIIYEYNNDTKRGTEEFKQIEAVYLACKTYLIHLNK